MTIPRQLHRASNGGRLLSRIVLGTALPIGSLLAQTPLTIPAGTAGAEQPTVWVASGPTLPTPAADRLHQVLYGPSHFQGTATTTWTSIGLRPDARGYDARTAQVALTLSSQGLPTIPALSTDAGLANRGSDALGVIAPRSISLPAVSPRFDGVPHAPVLLPFDRPFVHAETDGLLVELEWSAPGFPITVFDARDEPYRGWTASTTTLGPSCSPRSQTSLDVQSDVLSGMLLSVSHFDSALSPTSRSIVVFGTTARTTPLDAIGAPGCAAYVAFDAVEPLPNWGGVPGWFRTFQLDFDPNFVGNSIHAQAFVLEPGFNAAGIAAGAGVRLTVTARPPTRQARHVAFDPTTLRDGAELSAIPVLQLR